MPKTSQISPVVSIQYRLVTDKQTDTTRQIPRYSIASRAVKMLNGCVTWDTAPGVRVFLLAERVAHADADRAAFVQPVTRLVGVERRHPPTVVVLPSQTTVAIHWCTSCDPIQPNPSPD